MRDLIIQLGFSVLFGTIGLVLGSIVTKNTHLLQLIAAIFAILGLLISHEIIWYIEFGERFRF